MSHNGDKPDLHGGTMHIPRSRGALSGLLLVVLGAWTAVIPFIGPWFSYSYTPDKSWTWTAARGWLEVLPGAVSLIGGILLLLSANRVTASFGAWLGIAAGAWLVVGRDLAGWLHIGSLGRPASSHRFLAALESLGLFSGVGGAILLLAAIALGRLSIRSVRDVRAAQRREGKAERERQDVSSSAYAAGRRDEAARRQYDDDHANDDHADDESGRHGLVGRLTHRNSRTDSDDERSYDSDADNSSSSQGGGATATRRDEQDR